MRTKQLAIALLIILPVLPSTSVQAAQVTFEREYRHQASATDNQVTSRIIALEQVKLLLLEELGTYLENTTEVVNFSLTRDRITTLTAGIVRTTIIEESWNNRTYFAGSILQIEPKR